MKRALSIFVCAGSIVLASNYVEQHRLVPLLQYHDEFKDYYPKLHNRHNLNGLDTSQPTVVLDAYDTMKATFIQSQGSVAPSLGNVTIEGIDTETLQVSLSGFRSVRLEWVGSNLLYFNINIGHVANVESLLNVREKKWIYSKSIYYNKHSKLKIASSHAVEATNANASTASP